MQVLKDLRCEQCGDYIAVEYWRDKFSNKWVINYGYCISCFSNIMLPETIPATEFASLEVLQKEQ